MAPKLQAQFDAVKVLNDTQSKFEMVQILDENGNVVNEDYDETRKERNEFSRAK